LIGAVRPLAWLLALCVAAGAVPVVVPLYLIRPFTRQTPEGVAASYVLRAWAPALCLASLVAGLAAAALLWPRLRTWRGRAPAVLAVLSLAGLAWAARQNIFERMFRPVEAPAFGPAAEATHVKDDDLILGVGTGASARAYPVSALAYHHLVNDVVGDEPVVATY
jgi:hypothetical protein